MRPRAVSTVAVAVALLTSVAAAQPPARTPPLDGERLAGAFVTMSAGARCPSASTIAFRAQGEATGLIEGIFDARGTIDLLPGDGTRGPSVAALAAQLDFNQTKVSGALAWDRADPPLGITCDPLSLRIEGRLRYRIMEPFEAAGAVDVVAYGSRDAVTQPYFGRTVMTFVPAGVPVQPR